MVFYLNLTSILLEFCRVLGYCDAFARKSRPHYASARSNVKGALTDDTDTSRETIIIILARTEMHPYMLAHS